ncbi:MAG: cation:proton antiporter, partial [Alphaproteobacteria bacterium]|nr:cation:proton antiporter [Alphaproteobacteria bacterium]
PIASLTFCFAAAGISGLIDLSTAYGAFLAGLVLGNTNERNVLLDSTKPIQTVLLMVFFLSVGLLIDLPFVYEHLYFILKALVVVTMIKFFLNMCILNSLRLPWSQAALVSILLAQLGEFSFLLTGIGFSEGIITTFERKLIISLTVLSLALSPFLISFSQYVYNKNRGLSLFAGIRNMFRFKKTAQQMPERLDQTENP